ncbi:hypothetical protein L1887_28210 [Cichorium endivia]|nr:hypothetical protein L1887_28210 [Cichorium endivia]
MSFPAGIELLSSHLGKEGTYRVTWSQAGLHEQFDAEASSSSHGGIGSKKPLFYGVSIFVDGYTVPSTQVIELPIKHPELFESLASNLCVDISNETFDGVEEGYESQRDNVSFVSSYNPARGIL